MNRKAHRAKFIMMLLLGTSACVPVVDVLPSGPPPSECDHVASMAGSVIKLRQGGYPMQEVSLAVNGEIPTAPLYRSMVGAAWSEEVPKAMAERHTQADRFSQDYRKACKDLLKSAKNTM